MVICEVRIGEEPTADVLRVLEPLQRFVGEPVEMVSAPNRQVPAKQQKPQRRKMRRAG